jgi:hypothetical protein
VRIYLPATKTDIEALLAGQEMAARTGFALLSDWASWQDTQDEELLAEQLLQLAAEQSLTNGRRIVLVVEQPGQIINSENGLVGLSQGFGKSAILAMFADDLANKKAILAGKSIEDLDLTWFGPTEILEFVDFLAD